MNSRRWLSFLLLICLALPAIAQEITIKGIVRGTAEEPLIGASVMVKDNPTVGTITDFSGEYQLKVESDATIVVSYVGYTAQDVAVNGQSEINVTLDEGAIKLDEVVAIGYGTIKKEDATGAVSMIKPSEIQAGISTSAQDLLVGKTPGLVVTTSGGQPEGGATIRIRGGSSLSASNDPLFVIDGVPLDNNSVQGMANPLSMIAPDNIETMTVLKDASATAIFGSRASNGVIIVTTKKGTAGKPQINVSANMQINTAAKKWSVLDADEYSALIIDYHGADSEAAAALGSYNTDWQDEIYRNTISTDVNVSIGGTAGNLPYRVAANYTKNNGILVGSSMERATLGFNLTPKFFNDHLSVAANAKGYYIHNTFSDTGAIGAAIGSDPTRSVMTDYPMSEGSAGVIYNGYTSWLNAGTMNTNSTQNALSLLEDKDNQATVLRSNGNLQLDYALHFLPALHFNLNLGYDISRSDEYSDVAQNSVTAWRNTAKDGAATHYEVYQDKTNTLLDFYMNYKEDFNFLESNIDATAGYSWQKFVSSGGNNGTEYTSVGYNPVTSSNGVYTLTINDSTTDRIGTTYTEDPSTNDWATQLQLISFFGRVNYSILNKYLITATMRADATSRFSAENRWGMFPSVALAWKVTEEPFMESVKGVMNDLKFRASWGITGQQDIGSYFPYMAVYTVSTQGSYYYSLDGSGDFISTLYPEGYDANIKWEETTTWNGGLDFGFLNNRITASIDYYYRVTDDLLSYVPVAPGSTTTNYLDLNVGSLENKGIEFAIDTKPVVTKDLTWSLGYNISYNENLITKLNNTDNEDTYIATGSISGGTGSTVQAHKVGYPAYTFYLYEQVYDADGFPIEGVYVDQNGDGVINTDDKVMNHSSTPDITMALNTSLNYKNWDFSMSFRANIGNYVYNDVLSSYSTLSTTYQNTNLTNLIKSDYYFEGGTSSLGQSDYYLENASFVKCDNITLGYSWQNLTSKNIRLRVYGAVQNPFTITGYSGLDPEVYSGIDDDVYATPVTYTIGLVASF
ncbi:MAG: TonB-dependent receptor [Bacteroidales bacterium]